MKAVVLAAFALLAIGPYDNARAEMPTARAGDPIRIKVQRQTEHFYGTRAETSGWIYGVLVALTPDSLGLAVDQSTDIVYVLRASIIAAEKPAGIETHEDSGRFFGLVAGFVGGVAVGVASGNADPGAMAYGAVVGAAEGASAGYKSGAAIGRQMPHEHWEKIQRWPGNSFRCRAQH